jgi:hypothetical protein
MCRLYPGQARRARSAKTEPSVVKGFTGDENAQKCSLNQAFPDVIGTDYTLRGFDYVLGRHPASTVSYVSAIGMDSMLIGYGSNRADYTFIPGGMIPLWSSSSRIFGN